MINNITTFWGFLQKNTIEIPIIQRDYAQGRADKYYIRNSFLTNLKQALDGTLPNEEKTLKLDFVYGPVEKEKLNPLDGQQRLTTLWLLHWYIALRTNQLENVAETLRNFTYETRITSREFCQQLCKADNFKDYEKGPIVNYITSRTWFYSAWKQDPTIQSMLTMLSGTTETNKEGDDIIDGLEELFIDTTDFATYWEKLISDDAPIVFYYLSMQDFGLSDELYIKMNARGKQLTSFENFKADLIGYIEQQARDNKDWEILLDPQFGLPIKLDTVWMDIFWNNKSEDFKVDDIYFAFLNRFFLNDYIVNAGIPADDIGNQFTFNALYGEKSDDSALQYTSEVPYKRNNASSYENLRSILDNFVQSDQDITQYFPEWSKEQTFDFIPVYKSDGISTLTQKQRIVFYAICVFLEKSPIQNETAKKFKEWMRVVWNIVENANIETIPAMVGCMRLIKELSNECVNIYGFLTKCNLKSDFAKDQVQEEIAKARQIVSKRINPNSVGPAEDAINEAESCAFFKGAIRFLFRDENGEINEKSWEDFNPKWKNAWEYFDENGVKVAFRQDAKLLRYYFSLCTKWGQLWGFDYDFTPASWRNILLKHSAPVHQMLIDENPDFQTANYISKITNFENGYENMQKHVHEVLMKTDILVEASKNNMCLNWKYDTYCLYPSNAKADKKKYVIGNYRNEILSDLCGKGFAEDIDNRRFGSCNQFFWGWNVDFDYKNYTFRWHHNNYVYLMNLKPVDADNYTYRNPNAKGNDDIVYCCFNAKEIVAPEQFIEHLNGLIKEYEGTLAQCTDQTSEQPAEQ